MDWKVTVTSVAIESINFAMQQNYIPVIRTLVIRNNSQETLNGLTVSIGFDPEFAKVYEKNIERLEPGQQLDLSPVQILVSPDYVLGLTEKMVGNISIEVFQGEEVCFREHKTIELLAYDQWPGCLMMPELLSAFVTPNHPAMSGIITRAGSYLQQWTGSASITGYQTGNPTVVKQQMAAVYAALQNENIMYNVPPASFEYSGQRIRLADTVLSSKIGSCLDLSLLFAGVFEAIGLNPVIVIVEGHAFVGCWLEENTFSEVVQDDVSGLKKRTADGIDEICLLEATCITVGKNASFDDAVLQGKNRLKNEEDFIMLIDVTRSRNVQIRPIPMRFSENGVYRFEANEEPQKTKLAYAPSEVKRSYLSQNEAGKELTKQKMWERKLLDLSLRNMLLSFRVTKNCLQLMAGDLGQLEDALVSGSDFKIMPKSEDRVMTMRDTKIYELENTESAMTEFIRSEFKSKRIRTFIDSDELEDKMKNICRQAKISIEENGTNTLYLALGFLRWYETDISEKCRYAPLVLVPVDVIRKLQEKCFVLRIRDEEAQMNITLLEMLRQDFGINIDSLDPLPGDENGTDLKMVFNTVRQAVMGRKRWDVEELAFVGLFSFSQFIMWNDIRNRSAELQTNKVVSSLISGKLEWTPLQDIPTAGELDEKLSVLDNAIPTSADSSQMVAICAAAKGQSFVLHGPPGTGKSQTITNMISNCLYQGKSVLFVAEKMAALSVVQKRLAKIGLDPFCLELHSNRAKKRDVLEQLDRTLKVGHVKEPEQYEKTARTISELRNELINITESLHRKRNTGFSAYEAITVYETNKGGNDKVNCGKITIDENTIASIGSDQFGTWMDILHKLQASVVECGGVYQHPLSEICMREYSTAWRETLRVSIEQYITEQKKLSAAYSEIAPILSLPQNPSYSELLRYREVCDVLLHTSYLSEQLINYQNLCTISDQIILCTASGRSRDQMYQTICNDFEDQIFSYPYQNAYLLWKQANTEWFLPKALKTSKLLKELRLYAKNPKAITKKNMIQHYELLCSFARQDANAKNVSPEIKGMFGELWRKQPNWDAIEQCYSDCTRLQNACLKNLSAYTGIASAVKNPASFCELHRTKLQAFLTCFEQVNKTEVELIDNHKICLDAMKKSKNWFTGVDEKLCQWLKHLENLKAWCVALQLQDEAVSLGLSTVVEALNRGTVTANDMITCFLCAFGFASVNAAMKESPELNCFQGAQFDEKIVRFEKLDEEFRILTINEIIAKLSAKIPLISGSVAHSSEIGILQKSIRSGGRGVSVRKLFDSIPTLLRMLCPCMLMSPISVAQYIDPSYPKFDYVIFDEASQLPTCEAVGAIARGENVIVVGDPKQLPPTSFFMTNRVDEENYEKEDLESVLDDCLALSMPQEHLLWHYRSRHESLIAYSNMKYYDNKLFTFPSPNDLVSEVVLIPVEGCYDRSKTKQNRAEAEKVIQEIVRRLKDTELRKESIGVVTFSVVQQSLIEDMLEEAFRAEPELELICQGMHEPLFVKNLENVQGDERDVILFSIGYGPDEHGKVTMNFGPLNRDGGWRRLNVAISRSRKHMMIFSTLKPEQIDLSKTMSDGVAGLKGFLEFAARGKNMLVSNSTSNVSVVGNVETQIAAEIDKLGYQTECSIGYSEYKVAIGVIDPEDPERFLLGILCDGSKTNTETTVRDRVLLQPSVLNGLGWELYRLWTLDWLDSPEREITKIKTAIENAIIKKHEKEAAEIARELHQLNEETVNTESSEEQKKMVFSHDMFEKKAPEKPDCHGVQYQAISAKQCFPTEGFYAISNRELIGRQIGNIINREAPICHKRLLRKELAFWGITRSGAKIEQMLATIIREGKYTTTESNGCLFYWKKDQNPKAYAEYRKPTDDEETKRGMDEIPAEEICNAILDVLAVQVSLTMEDLIRETAKLFSFARLGTVIETAVKSGLEYAQKCDRVIVGERITLKD